MNVQTPSSNGDATVASSPGARSADGSTHLSDLQPSASPDGVQTSILTPDRSPTSLRYVLAAFHARGGMGEVWRCQDATLGREVALKRLVADSDAARHRFLCEAQITGQLEHPGIVPVHDLGFDDGGRPFYVMKLVRGRSLKAAIDDFHADGSDGHTSAEPRPLQRARLLNIFLDLCHAVAYAHSRGIIHRDLKPDNVMLGAFGETVVLDWGLAKSLNQPPVAVGAPGGGGMSSGVSLTWPGASTQHTQDGSILGSPLYMPPEMAEGHTSDADPRTDVYLLGATLYEILTGRPPRQGASRDELLNLARTSSPVSPRKLVSDTPPALDAICRKAMSRQRGHRYGSALGLADDVQRYVAGERVSAYREPAWRRAWRWARRHRRAIVRCAVGVVIAASMALGLLFYRRANLLQAQARAREQVREVRQLIDEARFYAASTDAPDELTPYFDPVRGDELANKAVAMAAPWGTSLERLPLDAEERAAMGRELAALAEHRLALKNDRQKGATTQPVDQDSFLAAERRRLASVAPFALPGAHAAPQRDVLLDAVTLYRWALDRDPTHYWARFQLGRCYIALGRVAESIETFSGCIALRPQAPWAYSARALALALSHRFEDAHRDLDRALAAAPDSLPARLNRGLVYMLQDEPARAAAEFDRLLALPQPLPEAAFYRAQLLLRDDRAQAALELLQRVEADHPKFTPTHALSAQALLALDRPADAVAELDQLIRSSLATSASAKVADIAAARGHLLRRLIPQLPRQRQRAALTLASTQLSDAIRADAADASVYADLGAIHHLAGNFAAAVAAYSSAAAIDANDPQILIDRGWSHEGLDHLAEARSDFAQALSRRPESAEALAGLGYIEARLGQSAEAQRHAALALLHAEDDYLILHNIACIYARLATGDQANARMHEDAAIALLARAVQIWRTTRSGPNELELITLEAAFDRSIRARAEFRALLQ